jgi:hypothetical protein
VLYLGCEDTINAPHVHTAAEDTQYNEEAHEECPLESDEELGKRLKKEGADLLGRKHSEAGKKRWHERFDNASPRDKRIYDKVRGPKPSKRQH